MNTSYVYHICRVPDKYNFSKGYIGISNNPEYRWLRHRKYEKGNHLQNCYKKYNDIVEYVVVKGSRDYCLFLEQSLRPSKGIGWNQAAGGGDPPSRRGIPQSQVTKNKIGIANSGSKNLKWKGWWSVDNQLFESSSQAAKFFNVTKKTIRDRCYNEKYPDWKFIPKE